MESSLAQKSLTGPSGDADKCDEGRTSKSLVPAVSSIFLGFIEGSSKMLMG